MELQKTHKDMIKDNLGVLEFCIKDSQKMLKRLFYFALFFFLLVLPFWYEVLITSSFESGVYDIWFLILFCFLGLKEKIKMERMILQRTISRTELFRIEEEEKKQK